jgi:hypothetical protein
MTGRKSIRKKYKALQKTPAPESALELRPRLELKFSVSHDEHGFPIFVAPYRNWQIELRKGLTLWTARIVSKGNTLKVKKLEMEVRSSKASIALTSLMKMPCFYSQEYSQSFSSRFELRFFFPKKSHTSESSLPHNSKAQQAAKEYRFLRGSKHVDSAKNNGTLLGNCKHGIPVESCPRCASWGLDYSGLREFD